MRTSKGKGGWILGIPPWLLGKARAMDCMRCDYRASLRYWFYGDPFVDDERRTDIEFMVNSVLDSVEVER